MTSGLKTDVISRASVGLYQFLHGRLHLPGGGWALRRLARAWPGLQQFPFSVPDVGTALLDFREAGAYGMVNSFFGELGNDGPLLRAFGALVQRNDVFWDVGANLGYLAQHLMRPPFQVSHLHAFEPSPTALRTLQSLFANHPRATVHPFGLGAANEILQMHINPTGSQLDSLVNDTAGSHRIPVPVRRADDVRKELNLPPPNVIKIDVEGFEPEVFEGMQETIREGAPIIIFEHLWLEDNPVKRLTPPGYELFFLLDDATLTQDFSRRRAGANAILLPGTKSHLLAPLRGQTPR